MPVSDGLQAGSSLVLETERLRLRDFGEDDWRAVLAYQQDSRYLRFYEWSQRTPEEVRSFVDLFIAQQRETPRARFQLAITLSATGRLIGNCGIRMEESHAREADIGYELDPDFWGHGYATEAARAVVGWGFSHLRLHRITAWCIAENAGSVRVLERLGMRREGRLRDKEYFKGRWWDALSYAILEEEWLARQGTPPTPERFGTRT
ncbi:MAG TPA: GNAT family protein [Anaerolineae bacterium]|nr:GNAT family protein [Anaerolineae bacterium]